MIFYDATIVAFSKIKKNNLDINSLEKRSQCQSYPYLISFMIKPDINKIPLMAHPENKSNTIAVIHKEILLIQIKKIDSKWLYVGVYDGHRHPSIGEIKGYVEARYLQPLD